MFKIPTGREIQIRKAQNSTRMDEKMLALDQPN